MRIVNLSTFLAMPAGTVFAKYAPAYFEPLAVKGETIGSDFMYSNLVDGIDAKSSHEHFDMLDRAVETGESIPLAFDIVARDGCFAPDQLFAVWAPEDVRGLIAKLTQCLPPTVD